MDRSQPSETGERHIQVKDRESELQGNQEPDNDPNQTPDDGCPDKQPDYLNIVEKLLIFHLPGLFMIVIYFIIRNIVFFQIVEQNSVGWSLRVIILS
jgi:hypothetical protein